MKRPRLRIVGQRENEATEIGEPWGVKCRQWPRRTLGAIGQFALLHLGISKLKPLQYTDEVTGEHLTICRSARYLIVSYGARHYYFDPLTGELEGTGSLRCCG